MSNHLVGNLSKYENPESKGPLFENGLVPCSFGDIYDKTKPVHNFTGICFLAIL